MYLSFSLYDNSLLVICILIAGVALAAFLAKHFLIDPFLKKADDVVLNNSKRLAQIEEINKRYVFRNVQHSFSVSKQYDNKTNYTKVEPAYIMTAELRNNLLHYTEIVDSIKANRELHPDYIQEINSIPNETVFTGEKRYDFPNGILRWREEKLCKAMIVEPATTLNFSVEMSYSSPKGKVNLQKHGTFCLNDVDACLQSVSRSRLDKSTYSRIAAVERGEVSDSLRYDVMNRDGFKCVICGATASQGAHLHVDHIIPIAKGGTTCLSNLRTLCERCNIGKSDKLEGVTSDLNETKTQNLNVCPVCGSKLILRKGKYGEFFGCTSYPKCKYTRNIAQQ